MNICEKEEEEVVAPEIVSGHVYKRRKDPDLYFCGYFHDGCRLFNLTTGYVRSTVSTFAGYKDWEDVTDKYCIQEIK